MTQLTAPEQAPNLDLIRTARDGTGIRVYHGGDLLGSVRRVRLAGRGTQKRWRWLAKPAAYAWTQGRPIGERPSAPPSALELLDPCVTRLAAVDALVRHLRAHGAPAVEPLYGAPRG